MTNCLIFLLSLCLPSPHSHVTPPHPPSSVCRESTLSGLIYNTHMSTHPLPPELAPCGIYCGACPSLGKTCLGCASQEEGGAQQRKSKWGCKLRVCCYEEKGLIFCSECEEYPCAEHKKKLTDSHPGDPRFQYRRDVASNLTLLKEVGELKYLEQMSKKYTCPHCGGQIVWYKYLCQDCGEEVSIQLPLRGNRRMTKQFPD